MPVSVGIDLGSTHCNVGIWHKGRPEIIANHHGLRATPTMVAFTDEEVLAGEAALTQMAKNQANTIFGFKWMVGVTHAELEPHVVELLKGAPYTMEVDDSGVARVTVQYKGASKQLTADTLCTHLFEHLKSIAEEYSGESVGKCVLAIPADFGPAQRSALLACGKAAGLPIALTISDPIATAIAYGVDRCDEELRATGRDDAHASPKSLVLVVDFGGGGVEASLIRRNDGMLTVAGTCRDAALGGGEFTKRLVEFCAKDFKRKTGSDVMESKRALLKLTRECDNAVKTLSMSQQAEPYVEALMDGADMKTRVTRLRFEDMCYDLYEKAKVPIKSVLERCSVTASAVDLVLLAGGIAHMPKIQSIVRSLFPEGTVFGTGLFPDEAIAIGATIQASLLEEVPHPQGQGPPLPASLLLCPTSIGIRCIPPPPSLNGGAAPAGDDIPQPSTVILIEKGAPLPAQTRAEVTITRAAAEEADGRVVLQIVEVLGEGKPAVVLAIIVFGPSELPKEGDLSFDVGVTLRTEGVLKAEAKISGSKTPAQVVIVGGQ